MMSGNDSISMGNIAMGIAEKKQLTDKCFAVLVFKYIENNVLEVDEKNIFSMCNSNILKLTGYKSEKEFAENFFDVFAEFENEDEAKPFYDSVKETICDGQSKTKLTFVNGEDERCIFNVMFMKVTDTNKTQEQYIFCEIQDLMSYISQSGMNNTYDECFEAIVESTPLVVNVFDKKMNNIMCNRQVLNLFEISDKEEYLEHFFRFSPEYQPNGEISTKYAKVHVKKAFEDGYNKFRWLHQNSKKEEIPCEITLTRIELKDNEKFVVGFVRDLRPELIKSKGEDQYEHYFFDQISDKTLLSKVSELSSEWFYAVDLRTLTVQYYGNNALSYRRDQSKLGSLLDEGKVHKDDTKLYKRLISNAKKGVYEPLDIRYLQNDGSYRYGRMIYQTIYSEGKPIFIVGKGADIHDQKVLEERSQMDLLTNCYNKISAENIVSKKIAELNSGQQALFIVDIDNFKSINDNLGHFFGDEVLKEIARGLKASFRSNDVIARIGGDEFTVFVEGVVSEKMLEQKAKTVLKVFKKTYSGGDKNYTISGSIGIAICNDRKMHYSDLYKNADKALYQAKILGKNRFVFYDESLFGGTLTNLTKLENADRMAATYFDYELIGAAFNILYERNGDEFSIDSVLRYICQKYDADRCYIFESLDNGKTYDNTFEWCKEGVSKEKGNLQGLEACLFADLFKGSHNGIVYSNDLKSTFKTEGSYETMASQGIESFVHAQVKKDNYVSFILGLDDCTKARVWSEKEINSLQYIAKLFSIMLQRAHLDDKVNFLTENNKTSAYIMDNADNISYISDVDTYDLLYLNKTGMDAIGNPSKEEMQSKKCYELLQGKTEPCEFCTNDIIDENDFYEWTHFNPLINKTFLVKDKLIPFRGNVARLEIAVDITKLNSLEAELKNKLEEERVLVNCIETLHTGKDPRICIDELLEIIAQHYEARRSFIFEISDCKNVAINTAEWVVEDAEYSKAKEIPIDKLSTWMEELKVNDECYLVLDKDKHRLKDIEYEVFLKEKLVSVAGVPIKDETGKVTGFIGVDNPKKNISNFTLLRSTAKFVATFLDENDMLDKLNNLSYYDTLTGVKNRHSFRVALNSIEERKIESLGVAYIDISGLSVINEMRGMEFGDNIIKFIAKILKELFLDDVYRVGGDEFVVLKKNVGEREFESYIKELKQKLSVNKDFDTTIGYTWNKSFEVALKEIGDEDLETRRYSEILVKNLQSEIENGKFVVYLQPQINMKTGGFESCEALIRRLDADKTPQAPIGFIPFYEKEGIVSNIDLFVLNEVCASLGEWEKNGFNKEMKIAVNCSRMTVTENGIVDKFVEICNKHDVATSRILVEITETISGTCDENLSEILKSFSDVGFGISLDDFGSGYSNLTALISSDFDEIKIDMRLIANLHKDKKSKSLTKVALNICSEIAGLSSVAEGIETLEQFEILKNLNCDRGQGYYFDKPMPIADFADKYIKI